MRWSDRVVVITGASRGIGRAVATVVAERGARVGLVARSATELDAVLMAVGGRGAVAAADVADPMQLGAALARLEAELGPPDVLVANAGIGAYGPFVDIDPALIERLVRVNVLGTLHAARAVAPGMIARRSGHIVVVGSIAGRIGAPYEAVYSATKFAQVGFTEALAVELAPHGVRVSMVNPGPVATDFFAARGHDYHRSWPKQVPADQVADAVLRAVDSSRLEQFVPRLLGAPVIVRHLIPSLYRWGAGRSFRAEARADVARRR